MKLPELSEPTYVLKWRNA